MFRIFVKVSLAVLAAGSAWTAASATDILVQQLPSASDSGGGSTNGVQQYDDFRLTEDSDVTSVTWWAPDWTSITTGTFDIVFTTADGFYPVVDDPIYTATVSVTGVMTGGRIRFDVDLPTPAVLQGNTNLFISIVDIDPGSFFDWAYGQSAAATRWLPPGTGAYHLPGEVGLQGADFAWQLNGGPHVDASPAVPEPAAWAMMALGFGLVGATVRRRPAPLAGA